jgi:hypothetical protein
MASVWRLARPSRDGSGCNPVRFGPGVSTLIHVGDFGFDRPGAERGRYEKKLNTLLLERGAVLVVSPGDLAVNGPAQDLRAPAAPGRRWPVSTNPPVPPHRKAALLESRAASQ